MVYDLAVALHRMGHEVTVVGCKGSKLPDGIEVIETVPEKRDPRGDWYEWEREHYLKYKDRLKGFDVIHDHTWLGFVYLYKRAHPEAVVVHTHHGHCTWPSPPPVRRPCMVGISVYLANEISARLGVWCRHAYNGVSLEDYPFCGEKLDYLVYIGRITKYKQPHVAIEVAKRARVPIYIIGGERFVEDWAYVQTFNSSLVAS